MRSSAQRATAGALLSTLALLLPWFSAGCSSSSSSSPPLGFAVKADPEAGSFSGSSLQVSLTVVGKTDPNPVIHYTTDLSEPTAVSPVYAGPFTIGSTTVVKAIAINPDTTETEVLVKGYVLADNPFRAEWAESGHGDIASDAFRHWDEDGEVSTSCTRCHGTGGLKDYAADGIPDNPGGLALGHDCDSCHESLPLTIYDWRDNFPWVETVVYSGHSYPYWFYDTDGDGMVTPGEDIYPNRYRDFDRGLLRAAFNYHSAQDPCGDIHNYKYVLQSVYDSADILDNLMLDGSIVGTRP